MRRSRRSSRVATAPLLAGVLVAAASAADEPSRPCIQAWPETRYANYAYDHVVHLQSDCPAPAVCLVSTDVSPTPIEAQLPAGRHVEVLTRRGSPARYFTPSVACRLVR
jgi:hypothetical protein